MADWRRHAACAGVDPELFFPVGTTGAALVQAEEARSICRRCWVQEECLDDALTPQRYEPEGIWGGLDQVERKGIRRKRYNRRLPSDYNPVRAQRESA